jgi:predicted NAD-dependent protein-ADP-ribosyltransferase YbiA (DUF1768 family)
MSYKNRHTIDYKETTHLDLDDAGYKSPLYLIELFNKKYIISIGREKQTYSKMNIYYFPVYLIFKMKVFAQIGVYQIESIEKEKTKRLKPFLDEDGDMILDRSGSFYMYQFLTEKYLDDSGAEYDEMKSAEASSYDACNIEKTANVDETKSQIQEDPDENDPFSIKIPLSNLSLEKEKINTILADGLFTIDTSRKIPDRLIEETKEQNEQYKRDFKESASQPWVVKFMKNENYNVVETQEEDSLLNCVRMAFKQIGHITTNAKIRAKMADEANVTIYEKYRNHFFNLEGEKLEVEEKIKKIGNSIKEFKTKIEKETDKKQKGNLIKDATDLSKNYGDLKETLRILNSEIENMDFIKGIDSIEKFRELIQQTRFPIDEWGISIIEYVLNIKIFVLSQESYRKSDNNTILQCGKRWSHEIQPKVVSQPDYYIIVSENDGVYQLISYKNKYIFKFTEVPYGIKILTIIKCIEQNSGQYYLIDDFRNFKSKMGVNPDEGEPDEDDDNSNGLYDPSVVLSFNATLKNSKPGKLNSDKINESRKTEFLALSKKINENWRNKLDDYWITPFTLDGKRWSTIEHFYQASKFRNGFPDFYEMFSLDSNSENKRLQNEPDIAHWAGSRTGHMNDNLKKEGLRPQHIKIDPTFYNGENNTKVRERALYAKFKQNEDLKRTLMDTRDAKLVKYITSSKSIPDIDLMKVRKVLNEEKV